MTESEYRRLRVQDTISSLENAIDYSNRMKVNFVAIDKEIAKDLLAYLGEMRERRLLP